MAARKTTKTDGDAANKAAETKPADAATEPAATEQAANAVAEQAATAAPAERGPSDAEIKRMIAKVAAAAGITVLMPRPGKDGKPVMKPRVGADGQPEDSAVYDAVERAPESEDILAFIVTENDAHFVTADGRKHVITR